MDIITAFAVAFLVGYFAGTMTTAHWLNWRAYQRLDERMSKRK